MTTERGRKATNGYFVEVIRVLPFGIWHLTVVARQNVEVPVSWCSCMVNLSTGINLLPDSRSSDRVVCFVDEDSLEVSGIEFRQAVWSGKRLVRSHSSWSHNEQRASARHGHWQNCEVAHMSAFPEAQFELPCSISVVI